MGLIFIIANFTLLLMFIVLLIKVVYAKIYTYWKVKGIPQLTRYSALPTIGKVHYGVQLKLGYDVIRSEGLPHVGVYILIFPIFIPTSPTMIKCILQQDFGYFTEKGFYYNERDDPLSANLFALGGERWKYIRAKLSPSFTVGKIKLLFNTLVQCGSHMEDAVDTLFRNGEHIEIKEISTRYSIDVIGTCVYGLHCNTSKQPDNQFSNEGRKLFRATFLRILTTVWGSFSPRTARFFGFTIFNRDTINFFVNIVDNAVRYRKENGVNRKDVLHSLIKLLDKDENGKSLSIEQISGQAFVFFAAGFETSSTTIAFCLYELCHNADIQARVRSEILLKKGTILTYDDVMEMKYLDQVIDETLRKYPPVAFLVRKSSKDYKIPETNTTLPKGTNVSISILGLHRDPEYFPDPDKFDPERFSPGRKHEIQPYTYLPFGEGPRICIGLRFGLLQVKIGLIFLLSRYKFELNSKTKVPLEMDPYSFTMVPRDGIYLNIEKVI